MTIEFSLSGCVRQTVRVATLSAGITVFPLQGNAQGTVLDIPALEPLEMFQECEACPEMIVMPMGSFMMGAMPGESRDRFDIYGKNATLKVRGPDEINIIPFEHPRHAVEMDIPYAIGRNEVTHAQWMACVDDAGCTHVPDHRVLNMGGYRSLGSGHPVVNVSYLDALEYAAWLNSKVGAEVYRLPTEAEWEYAARAGTVTRFAQGDEITPDKANFSGKSTRHVRGPDVELPDLPSRKIPVPVEELDAANQWGVRHMAGNVYELTLSCWSDEHLGLTTDSAYLADAGAKDSCRRVAKGGAFTTAMDGLRPARRTRPTEDRRRFFRGFRIVRVIGESGSE